jgi:putative Holliday junction resolvase
MRYAFGVRALGIDYGTRRIGLALSDSTGVIARPWKAIPRHGNAIQVAAELVKEIDRLRQKADGLAAIVLGFPRRLSGEPGEHTTTVKAIAAQLRRTVEIPVVLQDERLSSREAESRLSLTHKDWRKRKPMLDAAAAAVILQDYLDSLERVANGAPVRADE